MVFVDHAGRAIHGPAFVALAGRPVRLKNPFVSRRVREQLLDRDRLAEQVPLNVPDFQFAHHGQLVERFDTFGDCFHIQCFGQCYDCGDDCAIAIGIAGRTADKALVDLDLVERRGLEIGKAGIPGAEIIKDEPYTQVFERFEHCIGCSAFLQEHTFGYFQFQAIGIETRYAERQRDDFGKRRVDKLD